MPTAESLPLSPLPHLDIAAAVALLQAGGVKGSQKQLEQLAQQFEYDELALDLVAAYLKRWYAGHLKGLESIPILYDNKESGRGLRRIITAFQYKLEGASDMTLLYLLSLSDDPVPQQHMKLVFRSTLLERWLSRRDDYVRFLGPLGRLNEDHWHWVIENLRRLHLLEPAIASHHDLLLVPPRIREYLRAELRLKQPVVYEQGSADIEKLFKETVISLYEKLPDRAAISTYLSPKVRHHLAAKAALEAAELRAKRPPPVLWQADELQDTQQQLVALRDSLAALRQHSQFMQQQLTALRVPELSSESSEENPSPTSQAQR